MTREQAVQREVERWYARVCRALRAAGDKLAQAAAEYRCYWCEVYTDVGGCENNDCLALREALVEWCKVSGPHGGTDG